MKSSRLIKVKFVNSCKDWTKIASSLYLCLYSSKNPGSLWRCSMSDVRWCWAGGVVEWRPALPAVMDTRSPQQEKKLPRPPERRQEEHGGVWWLQLSCYNAQILYLYITNSRSSGYSFNSSLTNSCIQTKKKSTRSQCFLYICEGKPRTTWETAAKPKEGQKSTNLPWTTTSASVRVPYVISLTSHNGLMFSTGLAACDSCKRHSCIFQHISLILV